MAHFAKIQMTQQGKNIVLAGQNKQSVVFTKVELGDGLLGEGQSVDDMVGLVHSVMSLPLQNFVNNGDGTARLRFVLDNNNLPKGFFNREIGVFAKVGDGAEQLFAYTNAGNLADYIPGKESPISSKIINLHIIVGNAANLTIVAENSAYVTKIDLNEHKKATELDHKDGSVTTRKIQDEAVTGGKIAQEAIEKKHIKNGSIVGDHIADGVITQKHLTPEVKTIISDAGIAILQRSKTYAVGDIAYHKALPSWARLECVTAGTNAATLPTQIEQMVQNGGVMVTDGSVVWIIDDIRDGTPVGAVRGSLYLPVGYVKCNGATVQRADYPRLVALADRHRLWTDDVTANAGLFGRGDGTATMVLPNWTDRMVQLEGDNAGASVAAGLPNITGALKYRYSAIYSAEGSFAQGRARENSVNLAFSDSSTGLTASFDASRSNPIYGAAETVQPAAIKLIPIIRY